MMMRLKLITPILLVLVYTAAIMLIGSYVKNTKFFNLSTNTFINFQANYQLLLLLVALVSVASTYFLNPANFANYFAWGNIGAPTQAVKYFGIKANDGWLKTGIWLSIFISLATAFFMYGALKQQNVAYTQLYSVILWILLFSITNSFAEEMIFRLGIISPLKNLISPFTIFAISAILFGLPHLAGMPSGIIGAIMAGILGFILAKSMYETNGFFWAWFIHFLQDIIIFCAMYLMAGRGN